MNKELENRKTQLLREIASLKRLRNTGGAVSLAQKLLPETERRLKMGLAEADKVKHVDLYLYELKTSNTLYVYENEVKSLKKFAQEGRNVARKTQLGKKAELKTQQDNEQTNG